MSWTLGVLPSASRRPVSDFGGGFRCSKDSLLEAEYFQVGTTVPA
jgi:hypothetical protein